MGASTTAGPARLRAVRTAEAKNRLSELLAAVRRGARYRIFDRDTPVADLVPVDDWQTDESRPDAHGNLNLRAADAVQLGAALVSCESLPRRRAFVTLDDALGRAAVAEGFDVITPGRRRSRQVSRPRRAR